MKKNRLFALVLSVLLTLAGSAFAAPAGYVKKSTWAQTMLAARTAPTSVSGFKPFTSGVIHAGQPVQDVSIDVSGVDELWLVVTDGGDGDRGDIAVWADGKLTDKNGKVTPLTALPRRHERASQRRLYINENPERKPLAINGKAVARGLCGRGAYLFAVPLDRKFAKFQASLGIDDSAGKRGSAIFKVLDRGDNRHLWTQIESDFPLEADWMLQDAGPDAVRWLDSAGSVEIEKKMIGRVIEELGANGKAFQTQFEQLASAKADDPRWLELYVKACKARRSARLAPLAAKWPKIVFTKHHNMGGSHYAYTEAQSDAQAERTFHPGTALCILDLSSGEPVVTTLIDDPKGVIRDPDVSYDGKFILFAWKKSDREDDYHLYEMETASGKIRQITHGLGYADYEGQYLPNDDLVFSSSRCVQTTDCFTTEVSNLYTCSRDGKYLRRLGFDQVATNFPTVLADGRVVYTRWEYNDRGQIYVQGLMQMYPDGTGQTEFYGMNSWFPTTILHARNIPGSHKLVAVASGHHSRQTGKLCIIDNVKGRQENSGVQLVAPVRETEAVKVDAYGQEGELFQYPYALDERNYLVTYSPFGWSRNPVLFGVYFMDIDGRRELLASDPKVSCNQSIPLASRARPFVKPSTVDYRKTTGSYYMQDVYAGPGLAGVQRGSIKKLRVVGLEWRLALIGGNGNGGPAGGAFVATPVAIGNGAWDPKIILGEATVHEDGSAFFEVPARMPIYFQALDEKGHMVQSMRSWSTLQPGESAACVGCHEDKNLSPLSSRKTYAKMRGPQKLAEFYGPARGFSFPREVQPILDKHCIKCHNNREKPMPNSRTVASSAAMGDWSKAQSLSPIEAAWQYTTTAPGNDWQKPEFDSSKWASGTAGFGARGTPGGKVNTEWRTPEIWLRRTIELKEDVKDRKLAVWCAHDEDVEFYINGVMAVCETGHITSYRAFNINPEAIKALRPGKNVLAMRCRQTTGGQFIDAALLAAARTVTAPAIAVESRTGKDAFSLLKDGYVDKAAKRTWSDSYVALTGGSKVDNSRGHPNELVNWIHAQSAPPMLPPYSTGAARSKLMAMLEAGHNDVKLSREEMEKIACWIDLAVPYCADYLEANTWDPNDFQRHERLLKKRQHQEELERKAIEEYIRDRQPTGHPTAEAK